MTVIFLETGNMEDLKNKWKPMFEFLKKKLQNTCPRHLFKSF